MALNVMVGAGPVGRETARLLAVAGHEVRVVSRGGTGGIALDATDGRALAEVSAGAETIFMCAMADYTRWPTDFPPIMAGTVAAAQAVGARLVVLGNIYGYGAGAPSPLTPDLALAPTSIKGEVRVAMWRQALAARVPALEVRASDYLGHGAGSLFTLMTLPALLDGKEGMIPGDLDAPHAWSYIRDVARTLVAAARYRGDWGRAFHVPSQHVSIRDLAGRFAQAAGLAAPALRALSDLDLAAMSADALIRELPEMAYLFQRSLIVDAADTERLLGISASSIDEMVRDTLGRAAEKT